LSTIGSAGSAWCCRPRWSLFGPEVGAHARSAVGLAELPFGGVPVEIEAQLHLRG